MTEGVAAPSKCIGNFMEALEHQKETVSARFPFNELKSEKHYQTGVHTIHFYTLLVEASEIKRKEEPTFWKMTCTWSYNNHNVFAILAN
jgi:hypothetical protein